MTHERVIHRWKVCRVVPVGDPYPWPWLISYLGPSLDINSHLYAVDGGSYVTWGEALAVAQSCAIVMNAAELEDWQPIQNPPEWETVE